VHKLKAQGVEIVKGDGLKKDSLVDALRGSEAVFGVCAESDFYRNPNESISNGFR
jgi:uncharacterized protein YbjT (DUF2867 family)